MSFLYVVIPAKAGIYLNVTSIPHHVRNDKQFL